jgi:CO/xanthine dehydrogenase Mo-binding subunit
MPGTLWARAVRSPFPHAIIKSIDASKALKVPGVHGVLTAKDFNGVLVGPTFRDMPVLADGKVRFIGEKVAAVCADTEEMAEEAASLIEVEYEEIPTVFDPIEAMKDGAPILHEKINSYIGLPAPVKEPTNVLVYKVYGKGDVEKGFKEADRVFENTYTTTWSHQGYIEPTSCIVHVRPDKVHVWAANKTAWVLRRQLAEAVSLKPEQILIHAIPVGGDFGGKRHAHDTPLCYMFSKMTGRPVKMVTDYADEFLAGDPRHPAVLQIKTGVKNDGTITAIQARVIYNSGAYGCYKPGANLGGADSTAGDYRVPNTKIESLMVYTNTVPCGYMRAPGKPQAVFGGESNMDVVARAIGMDPAEFRRKNALKPHEESPTGHHWKDSDSLTILNRTLDESGFFTPKNKGVGRGIALSDEHILGGETYVGITLDPDGTVTARNSTPDVGSGPLTVTQIVVAEELGVPIESVKALPYDTDDVANESGIGGAKATKSVGLTAIKAGNDFKANLKKAAVETLGWNADKITYAKGGKVINTDTKESVDMRDIVRRKGAAVTGFANYGVMDRPELVTFCCHVVEVTVDEETGHVKLDKITVVSDAGTVINPTSYEGQIDGGLMQGIGHTLMEHIRIEDGRPVTTTFGDYKIPTMPDIPELKRVVIESPAQDPAYGPYGAKTVGELSISGVGPAIVNAIEDAVGVRIKDLPVTAEKIYAALQAKKAAK